jgi:hypothetical protein
MNAKKYLVAAMALNTALLAFAVSVSHRPSELQRHPDKLGTLALTGPSGKFGPVIETVLPAQTEGPAQILDFETGRALLQPRLDDLNSRADTIMAWIRSNGLDLSCSTWSGGRAACITYDMAILPIETKSWDQTTEQELLANPALAPTPHSPRRLLALGHDKPDTYAFRTAEGTVGILRIVGLDQHERGVKIRYKLIYPAQSIAASH